ncbi:MAG: IgGFc-binding protein [Myxococcales bacterium]|nr:IgGFc-binding protein [Myxococcales bacterium]
MKTRWLWALGMVLSVGCAAGAGTGLGEGSAGAPNPGGAGGQSAGFGGASSGGGPGLHLDAGSDAAPDATVFAGDPKSCAEAAAQKSYVGCDFWPTVTANSVWPIFDYTVVVANTQDVAAEVAIERGGKPVASGTVPPNGLSKLHLPWVDELKGPSVNECGNLNDTLKASVRAAGGAYHLTSSVPVTVYQFNALEYKGEGGPPGKDWSSCPAHKCPGGLNGCLSYSNDASLLLPTTALTGNYRIPGMKGWVFGNVPAYFSVTGTEDGTTVKLKVSKNGAIAAGGGLAAHGAGSTLEFSLGRGEVVQVMGTPSTDLSGSLLQASAPVQVVTGMACVYLPQNQKACDHIEESVFPVETWGTRYFVTVPTGPNGDAPGHIVRLYGNVDGTALSYSPSKPKGAPDSLNAGDVVDLDITTTSFEVSGSHELAVASFQLGATVVDPVTVYDQQKGDPAQSFMTAVAQYRKKYVFLAPDDYAVSYVDIVHPAGTGMTLDGQPLSVAAEPIAGGFALARVELGPGQNGSHVLESDEPVGIQVMGYGLQTSYQYPGGSNLMLIAPPPPPIK